MTHHSRKARKRRTLSANERWLIGYAIDNASVLNTAQRAELNTLRATLRDAIIIIEVPQHTHERVAK